MIAILTQNRTSIIKCQNISRSWNTDGIVEIYESKIGPENWVREVLGKYNTVARAQEVIDQIFRHIANGISIYEMPLK